jgi:hypothetical protein
MQIGDDEDEQRYGTKNSTVALDAELEHNENIE